MSDIIIYEDTLFKVTALREGLLRILMPGDVYACLAIGSERAMVIDTGCGYGPFRALIEKLTDKPYEVLLTHGHVDHAGGAAEFETVHMDPADLPIAAIHTQKEIRLGYLQTDQATGMQRTMDPGLLSEPRPLHTYTPLADGQIFDLGGLTFKALALPGHTPGSMAVLFREYGMLLTGDAVNSFTLLSLDGCLTVHEYRDSLIRFRASLAAAVPDPSALTVLYSHPHNFGGPMIVDEMIEVCDAILAGTDDKVSMPGRPGMLAKAMDISNGMRRVDGKSANLAYLKERV